MFLEENEELLYYIINYEIIYLTSMFFEALDLGVKFIMNKHYKYICLIFII